MPPAKKNQPSKKKCAPSFEDALAELEAMVETMESGQQPLEKLITNYERGAALIQHCESVLDDARKRLELITLKPKTSPNEGASDLNPDSNHEGAQEGTSESNTSNDDEIRLF